MSEWMDIETAPYDIPILVYANDNMGIVVKKHECWHKEGEFDFDPVGVHGYEWDHDFDNPTHWMPPPDPPK